MAAVKDLGVLSSAEFIVKNAGDVFIATKHVESAVDFVSLCHDKALVRPIT